MRVKSHAYCVPIVMEGRTRQGGRRYCNARCRNAKGEKCKCTCGGMNHGESYEKARANVRAYLKLMMPELPFKDGEIDDG